MKIEVTQKHIDRGLIGNKCECPIALALKDAYGKAAKVVQVTGWDIQVNKTLMATPPHAASFIWNFDGNWVAEPITIETPWWFDLKVRYFDR